jgi:hypothetical protein
MMDNVAMDFDDTRDFFHACLNDPRRSAEMLFVFGSWALPSCPGGLYLCTRLGGSID